MTLERIEQRLLNLEKLVSKLVNKDVEPKMVRSYFECKPCETAWFFESYHEQPMSVCDCGAFVKAKVKEESQTYCKCAFPNLNQDGVCKNCRCEFSF